MTNTEHMPLDILGLKWAQNVLNDVLMADMKPEKLGRHVSTERLTEMMIKAYLENAGDAAIGNDAVGLEQPSIAPPHAPEDCWEAFENFMRDEYGYKLADFKIVNTQYDNYQLQCNWRLWQAAWKAPTTTHPQ